MAGQMEQGYRNDPLKTPDITAAPTIQTEQAHAVGSQFDGSIAAGAFQAMGNSFGNFFGNVNKSLETVNSNIEAARKQEIQQQNKDLATQGAADAASGKPADTLWTDRSSYMGAFQKATAQTQATQLSQGFQDILDKAPMDGTFDPALAAKKHWEDQFGPGTGDRQVDNQTAILYADNVRALSAHFHEKTMQTMERNTTEGIIAGGVNAVQQPNGINQEQLQKTYDGLKTINNGDEPATAKMLFTSLAHAPQNVSQALALQGAIEKSGLDEKYPVEYAVLKEQVLSNVTHARSIGAATAQQELNMELHGLISSGTATVDNVADWMSRYQMKDSQWGFGPGGLETATAYMMKLSKQTAGVNVVLRNFYGQDGHISDVRIAAKQAGVTEAKLLEEHAPQAMAQIVQEHSQGFPALSQTTINGGYVNPMENDQAAAEYVPLVTSIDGQRAFAHTQPDYIQKQVSDGFKSQDIPTRIRAFKLMDGISTQVGDNLLGNYFKDSNTLSLYHALKLASPNGDVSQIMQWTQNHPDDQKLLERATESGRVDWTPIFGKETKAQDMVDAITKQVRKQALGDTGTGGILFDPKVGISTEDMNAMQSRALVLAVQLRGAGGLSVDAVAQGVAKAYADTRLMVTGQDGAVRMIADPYEGRGRNLQDPLNPNGPYGVDKGFPAIVTSRPVMNAFGALEQPLDTAKDDLASFHGAFPGKTDASPKALSLGNPDAKLKGLMPVMDGSVAPIRFAPGEKVTTIQLTGPSSTQKLLHDIGDGASAADRAYYASTGSPLKPGTDYAVAQGAEIKNEVPKDPEAAAKFWKDNLPAGFYAVKDNTGLYQIFYGYRVKGDQKAAQAKLDANTSGYNSDFNANQRQFQNQLSEAAGTRGTVR